MLDLERLTDAIENLSSLKYGDGQKDFCWSGLVSELDDIEALYINGAGLVSFPLNSDDIIQHVKQCTPRKDSTSQRVVGNTCCQIEASQITVLTNGGTSPTSVIQNLTYSTMEKMLDISFKNLNFSITAKLERLVICGNGESYKASFNLSSEPGKFGTLLLKLPMKAHEPSGSVDILDGAKETRIEFGDNNHFSIAAMAGFSSSKRKPCFTVHSGPGTKTGFMIFSLIWEDHITLFGTSRLLPPCLFAKFAVLTNQVKTALSAWEIAEPKSEQDTSNIEPTDFLCIPLEGLEDDKVTLSSLYKDDMVVAWSLMSVTFLDVHVAYVQSVEEGDSNEESNIIPAGSSSSTLEFKTGNHSPLSLEDDIFDFLVDPAKHMLYGDFFRKAYADPEEYPAPVIVIRSRSHRYLMIREQDDSEGGCALLVRSLESRLNDYVQKKALKNPFVLEVLLNELRQLIDLSKKSVDSVGCTGCFFTRLFDASLRLKDENLATTILKDVLILWELKELFYCDCENRDYEIKPAISFANLIRFSKGWSSYPDAMKKLTNQMLADGNAWYVSEIAQHLLMDDDLKGASETFQLLLEAVENSLSTPGEMEKIFHAGLVSLALRLHEEEPNQKAFDTLLHLIKHIEPSQFAKLAKTMSEWITEESLDCKHFLNELGSAAIENQFRNFTPQQFLMTVEAFRSSDMPELVQQSWKIICSRCIEIYDSKEASKCLLCDFLKEPKSDEDRQQMTSDLTEVEEFNEAVKCSFAKLKINPASLDVNDFMEYIYCIQLMEEPAHQLQQSEVIKHFSECFTLLTPEFHFHLLSSLFISRRILICQKTCTMNIIFENLLGHMGNSDQTAVLEKNMEDVVFYAAWYGQLDTIKLIVDKLRRVMAISNTNSSRLPSAILRALRCKVADNDAASSLHFSRETFHFLIKECLILLENQRNRSSYAACFCLLSTAERSFIDATPAFITEHLKTAAKSFTFSDVAAVVGYLFEKEANSEEPSLKKFPTMWNSFKSLSLSLHQKWESISNERKLIRLTEDRCVSLMQCSLWIGDEKVIAVVCNLINQVQRSEKELGDVHSAIIREKRTMELATSSPHGILAINDLIDARSQILNQRLIKHSAYQTKRVSSGVKFRKVDSSVKTTDQLKWQKEIDELQALRKQLLSKSLLGQAAGPSSST